jgi:hypothetical protein
MFKSVILLLAVLALASAFAPFAKFGRQSVRLNSCEDRLKDKKGKCPGETGYTPVIKEAPTDFAVRLYLCVNLFSDNPNPDLF